MALGAGARRLLVLGLAAGVLMMSSGLFRSLSMMTAAMRFLARTVAFTLLRRMRTLATFAAGRPRFFRRELVSRALGVGCLPALPSGGARFFGRKLMSGTLGMGCLTTLAGDRPLFFLIHGGKTTEAFFCHWRDPFYR
jgi:hypothetical protein